jgi:hypothetical protein
MSADIKQLLAEQLKKDCYFLPSGEIIVPAKTSVSGYADKRILVENDADFYIQGITGSYAYAWTTANDNTILQGTTIYKPYPVELIDDVFFRVYDGSSNRLLSGDYVSVDLFFTGGSIGKPLYMVMPMRHIVQRNSFLRFEFQNNTSTAFRLNMLFHGYKYF